MTDQSRIERWVRPSIRAMQAYHVQDASGLIKLDAMENPYAWPGDLEQDWLGKISQADINRYPDPQAEPLKARLRQQMGIADNHDLLLGNGSDELILLLAMAVAAPGRTLLSVEPSFVMYRHIALSLGLEYQGVNLTPDFQIDTQAVLSAIEAHQPALIFIAQPNNPTGGLFTEEAIRAIIEAAPGLVVVDEAYLPFTDNDSLPLLQEYDHLLVMRTLSKAGLAGLRLGLLVGSPEWVGELDKIRLPYNINCLTQASAEFALDHYDVLAQQTQRICAERQTELDWFAGIDAIETWPTDTNFILFRTPEGRAKSIHQALKEQGVLIKCLDGGHPLLKDCLRVTVGTPEENQRFQQALLATL